MTATPPGEEGTMDIAITYCTEYRCSLTAIASVRERVKLAFPNHRASITALNVRLTG
jgi:hypothetical protein